MSKKPNRQQLPAADVTAGGKSAFVQFHRSTSCLSPAWMSSTPNNRGLDGDLEDVEILQLTSSFAFDDTFVEKGRSSHNSVWADLACHTHDIEPTNMSRKTIIRDESWIKALWNAVRKWLHAVFIMYKRSGQHDPDFGEWCSPKEMQ